MGHKSVGGAASLSNQLTHSSYIACCRDDGNEGKKVFFPKQLKKCVIASSNLVYGLLRMYEVFSEGNPVRIRVFRQPDEAMAWVNGLEDE